MSIKSYACARLLNQKANRDGLDCGPNARVCHGIDFFIECHRTGSQSVMGSPLICLAILYLERRGGFNGDGHE